MKKTASQRQSLIISLFNQVSPAVFIVKLAPLNTCKGIVKVVGDLADFAAVYHILNVLVAKLSYRGDNRRGAAAPSLLELAVFKRLAQLLNA